MLAPPDSGDEPRPTSDLQDRRPGLPVSDWLRTGVSGRRLSANFRSQHAARADRCFAAAGPRLWNTLPVHLRQCDSLGQFKRLFKTHLFGVWDRVAL